jgi:hypothetical protein
VAVTVTPGITPPVVSLIVPEMLPLTCAKAVVALSNAAASANARRRQTFADLNKTNLLCPFPNDHTVLFTIRWFDDSTLALWYGVGGAKSEEILNFSLECGGFAYQYFDSASTDGSVARNREQN